MPTNYTLPQLNDGDTENLNEPITNTKTAQVIKNLPEKESP